jgi:glycerol-3-phosphate acyltransferase PlsY
MLGPVLLVLAGYLVGSLPFGYWIVRVARGEDVRQHGSGNTGATNVWRSFGRRLGVLTLVLDVAKGFVPTLVAERLYGDGVAVLVGAGTLIGHSFPIFLGLGGGKGVATGAGTIGALCPACLAVAAGAFVGTLWLTRYVSLGSIAAAIGFLVSSLVFTDSWPVVAFAAVGGAFVVWRHRANIARLRRGQEPRVSSFGYGRR